MLVDKVILDDKIILNREKLTPSRIIEVHVNLEAALDIPLTGDEHKRAVIDGLVDGFRKKLVEAITVEEDRRRTLFQSDSMPKM